MDAQGRVAARERKMDSAISGGMRIEGKEGSRGPEGKFV